MTGNSMREAVEAARQWVVIALWAALVVSVVAIGSALATWKPEYASQPQAVQDWYKNAELTPAARERFSFQKCCDQSDVVKTKFRVGANGHDVWEWLNPDTGKYEVVPADIIHYDEHAPGGMPVLFVFQGQPTCFFVPDAGI